MIETLSNLGLVVVGALLLPVVVFGLIGLVGAGLFGLSLLLDFLSRRSS